VSQPIGRYTTEHAPVAQTQLYLLKGGSGHPMVVLHGVEGHEGWLAFHEALAESATVYAPSHPGYGHTDCPPWISSIQHQSIFYHWFLQNAGLLQDAVDLVGIGVGGWIAAQMAVMSTQPLRHLVLVDAAGIRPEKSDILDIFVTPWQQVLEQSFYDAPTAPEFQRIYGAAPVPEFGGVREAGRTMSMRMCFRPYMYDPALPGMLGKVRVPTLVVWGRQDRIVPLECANLYQRAIPDATVRIIDDCGHFAHLDKPESLAAIVREFVSAKG
jgi:pimeloyl-ACP methyl ester carboxylesterase